MSLPRRLFPFAIATLLALAAGVSARQSLPGCLRPEFAAAPRLGGLDSSTTLNLDLCLSPPDPGALAAFIAALYDPHSPGYRRFLSPQEFAERFGPSASDYRALQDFARAAGFRIMATHTNRLLLRVQGRADLVERAFHTTLGRRLRPDGSVFYAPDTEPSADLDVTDLSVHGLDNFGRWRRLSRRHVQGSGRRRAAGTGSGGAYQGGDFRDAYVPGVSLTGAGQSIGLIEFGGFYYADITAYAQTSTPALSTGFKVQPVLVDGYNGNPLDNGDTGYQGDDCSEVSLDIELALSMAPQAAIVPFETEFDDTMGDVLSAAAADTACAQTSCSWIGGDMGDAADELTAMTAQGQAFFQAAGDNGAYASNDVAGTVPEPQSLTQCVSVVGGTDLGTGNPAGGGVSYLSESTWNDFQGSCSDFANGCGDCAGGASGGGICDTNVAGTSAALAIPAWQAGVSMATNGGSTTWRNIPDVSAVAENFWAVWCDECPSGDDGGAADQQAAAFDGTSGASPLWAAFTALVNQQIASVGDGRLGFANPALYSVAQSGAYSGAFHDIADGSNNGIVGTGRGKGSGSCDPVSFTAVAGYDLATGWGSPNGQALINALAGTVYSPTPTPTITRTPTITPTVTDSPTATHTVTPTFTPTVTNSPTTTDSPTITPTFTGSPTASDSPTITPTFTGSPTASDSPTVTPTFSGSPTASDSPTVTDSPTATDTPAATLTSTRTPTPSYLDSGQGGAILVNDPARNGEPVILTFSRRPIRTRWRVYDLAAQLVARADIAGAGPHELSTQNLATGVYFARVNVNYASGASQILMFKFAVIR